MPVAGVMLRISTVLVIFVTLLVTLLNFISKVIFIFQIVTTAYRVLFWAPFCSPNQVIPIVLTLLKIAYQQKLLSYADRTSDEKHHYRQW